MILADIREPRVECEGALFVKTDINSWKALVNLFQVAFEQHRRIDIVCANAGIVGQADYVDLQDDQNGDLLQPSRRNLEVDLLGTMDTVALGIHYIKRNLDGGSVVVTGSPAGESGCLSFKTNMRKIDVIS